MIPLDEAIEKTLEFIRRDGGDYSTAVRFGAFSALAIAYGIEKEEIYTKVSELIAEDYKRRRIEAKKRHRLENEARRIAK